ncbi:MAG TPA: hypothetical protein ENL07_10445 [Chlorobaculum parvum]|uniref:Chromosome partitioning protein ParB n=1 Tax=Chlorobaculum parvum TaxID=274539 RepID=A0A7C5DFG5_9CHLB|nr:hypothetical protein [Chlorobaculum parvum]
MPKDIHKLFDYLPEITDRSEQGSICRVLVSRLRPTQNAVGFDEIFKKRKKIRKKTDNPDDLQDYLMQRAIPVIIGNGGEFYQIDYHHLAYSVWHELGDMYLPVEVVKNWSVIEGYSFWKAMRKNKWLYPFAGDGGGPLPPDQLKTHIKDLENDIFRSLSWKVREKYGYVKSPSNAIFAEFKWANFYRSRIIFDVQLKEQLDIKELTLEKVKDEEKGDYKRLLKLAMYLATSDEAKGLPGFRG